MEKIETCYRGHNEILIAGGRKGSPPCLPMYTFLTSLPRVPQCAAQSHVCCVIAGVIIAVPLDADSPASVVPRSRAVAVQPPQPNHRIGATTAEPPTATTHQSPMATHYAKHKGGGWHVAAGSASRGSASRGSRGTPVMAAPKKAASKAAALRHCIAITCDRRAAVRVKTTALVRVGWARALQACDATEHADMTRKNIQGHAAPASTATVRSHVVPLLQRPTRWAQSQRQARFAGCGRHDRAHRACWREARAQPACAVHARCTGKSARVHDNPHPPSSANVALHSGLPVEDRGRIMIFIS